MGIDYFLYIDIIEQKIHTYYLDHINVSYHEMAYFIRYMFRQVEGLRNTLKEETGLVYDEAAKKIDDRLLAQLADLRAMELYYGLAN